MSGRPTALHSKHKEAGARMMDFAGWDMPVQYAGILQEHRAVRSAAGVFDISHMGEFFVRGPQAGEWLSRVLAGKVPAIGVGEARYAILLNEAGGVIDDLYVYRIREMDYLLVVNASKISEDAACLRGRLTGEVTFEDASDLYSAVAVQGPLAPGIFRKCFGRDLPPSRNRVLELTRGGEELWIATTGYTGEPGFEVICKNPEVSSLWDALTTAGCVPCGLGARDVLRLEMGYPLNGNDLSPERTPLEAGLGFFIDFTGPDFVGKSALLAQKENGIPSKLCGIVVDGKSPPMRPHYPVWMDGTQVGETASGGLSPTLGTAIAMAYLPTSVAIPGTKIEIDVRGNRIPARVVKKPFIQTKL